jgi:hypothetical protein
VFTPERRHKNVELGETVEEAPLRPVFCREHIQQGRGLTVEEKVSGSQRTVKIGAGV